MLFSIQNRLEEIAHLLTIILNEDECSLVKEQVRKDLVSNFSFECKFRYAMYSSI